MLFTLVGCVTLLTLVMPETLSKVLLARRKAARLNKSSSSDTYTTEHAATHIPLAVSLRTAMIRPFQLMFLEPIVLCMSFYLSFVYSLLYATFFAFPIAFEEIRGWNMGMTGVSFVSIIVSCPFPTLVLRIRNLGIGDGLMRQIGIFIAMLVMPLQERLYARHCANGPVPEARLYPMLLGAM